MENILVNFHYFNIPKCLGILFEIFNIKAIIYSGVFILMIYVVLVFPVNRMTGGVIHTSFYFFNTVNI